MNIKIVMYLKQLLIILLATLMVGCASSKKVNYFQQNPQQEVDDMVINYEPTLQFGDILIINVAATEPGAAVPFNLYEAQGNTNLIPLPYIVDTAGDINFPVIGKVKVNQYTTKELTAVLTNKLLLYLKNPIVNVRLTNFKVSVLGEVRAPGSYTVDNQRISILEAISRAGDLTIYGKRNPITLIREQNGKREFISIDLTSKNLFSSPYFYLAQNDVLYIESNKTKVNSSRVGPNTSVLISSLSILISLVAILVR